MTITDIVTFIASIGALLGVIGTVLYNRHKARTDHAAVALTGYKELAENHRAEIIRLEKRIEQLEVKEREWELERGALIGRIQELENENTRLQCRIDELQKALERVKRGVSKASLE